MFHYANRAPEVKETGSLDPEIKAAIADVSAAFEAFRKKNDERLAEIEKKGSADAVTTADVEKLNKAIDDGLANLKRRQDEAEAKFNRLSLGGGDLQAETKAAGEFSALMGETVGIEDLRAYKTGLFGPGGYLRKGDAHRIDLKTMSVGVSPDGGYFVTPDLGGRIVTRVYETTPMRQIASVVTIGTDSIEGFEDRGEGTAGWVGEKQTRSETDTPQIGKWSIPVNEVYAMPSATQKVLDDASFDIESWLAAKTSDKFARAENAAFLTGDGSLKPRGLLTYPTAATADATRAWGTFEHVGTGASGDWPAGTGASDKLIDLVFTLKAAYRQNANWLMSRASVAAIRKLKDGDGNYLWQPSFAERQGGLLLGYSIVEGEDMPAIGANALALAFGDFREAYTIVDRAGVRVLRDNLTTKGFVKFYTTKRVGGGANNFEAVKFLKFA